MRTALPLAAGLALLLGLTGILRGFFLDDYLQLVSLKGLWMGSAPFDLYTFTSGEAAAMRRFIAHGPLPWWTLPELRLSFLRPLGSALLTLDHSLFGNSAAGYHVHQALWYAATAAAWWLVLGLLVQRNRLSVWVAAAALGLCVIDDANFLPATWIANRPALVSVTFGVLALWAHLRWREQGWRPGVLWASILFAAALAGGEAGIGLLAYLAAYEFWGRTDRVTVHGGQTSQGTGWHANESATKRSSGAPTVRRHREWGPARTTLLAGRGDGTSPRERLPERLRALAPACGVLVVYIVIYRVVGGGAHGSAMYIDPTASPARYLTALPERLFALLGGLFLGAPTDLWAIVPATRIPTVLAGPLGVLLLGLIARTLGPHLALEERRTARWLTLGAMLSLLPMASTFPMNRLLLWATLGTSVLLALFLLRGWAVVRNRAVTGLRRTALASGLALLTFANVLLPLVNWPLSAYVTSRVANRSRETSRSAEIDDRHVAAQRLVLLNGPEPLTGLYPATIRYIEGRSPHPLAWWLLSLAPYEHRVRRTGERQLEIEVVGGRMLDTTFEQIFREDAHPLSPGQNVALDGARITVLAAQGGGPTRIRIDFARALSDPSLYFLAWIDGALRHVALPALGETLVLPRSYGVLDPQGLL